MAALPNFAAVAWSETRQGDEAPPEASGRGELTAVLKFAGAHRARSWGGRAGGRGFLASTVRSGQRFLDRRGKVPCCERNSERRAANRLRLFARLFAPSLEIVTHLIGSRYRHDRLSD